MAHEKVPDIFEYIQKIVAIMGIRKTKCNHFNIFEIMKDRYQNIIYQEKIKLTSKLVQIDNRYKLTFYFSFFIIIVVMICLYF
ncbi:hypothetical protein B0A79_22520 [Flavobacterium piscis]|uniref:Uncharacterized protein n=1 Tax=Flavobacterium piscis TaxID=1114874 RepID=A0ABX2XHF6_9FLAO|nr:hypothetical protein FLP_16805 [Flavobacterium piscis]OXE96610.1 hypothetical protein B0A79_22520 [Flavobacterium piscis]